MKEMNTYMEMKHRQEMDYSSLVKSASNKFEFKLMMRDFGLNEDETDKIISLGDSKYIRRSDLPLFEEIGRKHIKERNEMIKNDRKGNGFIYQMFLKELNRVNYGYTGEVSKALNYLGLSMREIRNDPALMHGFNLAVSRF